jgi:hypothetical protein
MSKVSSKQRYVQFTEWLDQLKKTSKTTKHKKQSRLDYYQQKGN